MKTILNFLVARIAAISLFQFDLDKPWNYPQYCNEKCYSAPFWKSRGKCSCHFPAFQHPCFFSHNIKLFGFLLSAVTVSLHYLPRCLRSTVTGGKTPIAATWSEPLKNWLPCYCYTIKANSGTILSQVSQSASASKWAGMSEPYAAHHCMIPEQWSCLLCSVWSKYTQTSMKRLRAAYNNAYRIMHYIPRNVSVRPHQVSHCVANAVLRNNLCRFFIRCTSSSNFFIRSLQMSDAFYKSSFFLNYSTLLYGEQMQ